MKPQTSAQAIAEATSLLVADHDVADLLSRLLRDCTTFLPVVGAGILVRDVTGNLELLSTTSHAATQLEIYQELHDAGPCVEVITEGTALSVVGDDALVERWPVVGELFTRSGITAAHAFPMVWRGRAIGGLNLFSATPQRLTADERTLAQSLADLATIALARSGVLSDDDLHERIQSVLEQRVVVEQAKGVVAVVEDIDLGAAFDRLVALSDARGETLAQVAAEVIASAQHRA